MAHRLTYWENKNRTIEESKKYTSRLAFCKGSYGAYTVSKKNGWLDEMPWLNSRNVYKDPVDVVYKYHFITENAVYVGRTIYPELRDKQHRERKNDTVYKYAKERGVEIPKMEILEDKLTVIQGAKREVYWAKYHQDAGIALINKQPCGSLGLMCKGKWSKKKCFEESKKYSKRSEFQRNCSQAYHLSVKNGWIDEMTWLKHNKQLPSGYWTKENIIKESKKYKSVTEFQKGSGGAFNAARKYNIIKDFTWLNKQERVPNGYWKDKKLLFEESKKYTSKNEFRKCNQSAYWAAYRYNYLKEMTWLMKNKPTKKGFYKNKEFIMGEGKKYNTRGDFEKYDKSSYSAALRYGWLDEMDWLPKNTKHPRGYWDNFENVVNEAKKYSSKLEIKENEPYLYKIMFKKGYINELNWLK